MENLDATIDNMENSRFAALYGSLIKELAATSEMSQTDITCLLVVYYKFSKANGPQCKKMTKKQFYQIFLVLFNVANVQVIELRARNVLGVFLIPCRLVGFKCRISNAAHIIPRTKDMCSPVYLFLSLYLPSARV